MTAPATAVPAAADAAVAAAGMKKISRHRHNNDLTNSPLFSENKRGVLSPPPIPHGPLSRPHFVDTPYRFC